MLVVLGFMAGQSQTVLAQQPDGGEMNTISVTGTGSASGSPDIAFIQFGVEVEDVNVASAFVQVNQRMSSVVAALNHAGIANEDIRTTGFNVRQEGPPQDPAATQDLYIVSNIAEVQVRNLDQISNFLQTALSAGANRVYGLRFGMENPEALVSQARQEAAAEARRQAEELAQLFDVTLGNPVQINESRSGDGPVPIERAAVGGDGGPVISEGQLSVTVQIRVTYGIIYSSR
jgi:hypothetical protein